MFRKSNKIYIIKILVPQSWWVIYSQLYSLRITKQLLKQLFLEEFWMAAPGGSTVNEAYEETAFDILSLSVTKLLKCNHYQMYFQSKCIFADYFLPTNLCII